MTYLREREMSNHVYHEKHLRLRLADGRSVDAVTYVADRRHVQYAAAAIVASARGDSGANVDYVANTLQHLRNMRVRDHWLEHVNDLIHRNINQNSTI